MRHEMVCTQKRMAAREMRLAATAVCVRLSKAPLKQTPSSQTDCLTKRRSCVVNSEWCFCFNFFKSWYMSRFLRRRSYSCYSAWSSEVVSFSTSSFFRGLLYASGTGSGLSAESIGEIRSWISRITSKSSYENISKSYLKGRISSSNSG